MALMTIVILPPFDSVFPGSLYVQNIQVLMHAFINVLANFYQKALLGIVSS